MPFLASANMDLVLLVFLVLWLAKGAGWGKGSGSKWLGLGAVVLLIPLGLGAADWSVWGLADVGAILGSVLNTVGGLLILLGAVKIVLDSWSK